MATANKSKILPSRPVFLARVRVAMRGNASECCALERFFSPKSKEALAFIAQLFAAN